MARNAIGTLRAVKIVHRRSFADSEYFEREFKGLLKFEPISRSQEGLVDVLQIGRRDDAGYFFYVMELADDAAKPQCEDGRSKMEDGKTPERATRHPPSSILDAQNYTPRTLRSEVLTRGRLPPTECVAIGLKLAAALEHLHTNGLVHRDIKPSNIIFVKGDPKLADIGLVTAIDEAQSLVGTAGYIPPEGPGTPQADLYSLGKVLYEIAFGKDRQEFPQLPPDLQSHPDYAALLELNEVILKACESDVRNRYWSAQQMQMDLVLLQEGKSVKQARLRKHRLGIVKKFGLAAGVVALLALIILYWKPSGYRPKKEALRLYEDGRWFYSQLTPDDHEKAFDRLSAAVEADPNFLQPYDELTILFGWARIPWVTNEQVRLEQTKKIEDKLLAIAPQSAERHTASSLRHFLERDWRTAEDEIVEAIRLKPDSAVAHDIYCFYLSMQGRIGEAKRIGQRAQELEPPYSRRVTALFASWPFLAERRFDLSIAQVQRVLELDQKFTSGYLYLGDCYEAQSNYLAAIDAYEKTADLWPEKDRPRVNAIFQALREAYNTGGQTGYFRKRIELAQADRSLPESEQLLRNFSTWDTAGYYARLGENEKALDELTTHFDEIHVWQQIKFRPLYDTLHHEPRFKELVKRAGLEP